MSIPDPIATAKAAIEARPRSIVRRDREAFLDDIPLDRRSGEGLASQLARQIRVLIRTGTLGSGTKLPASRLLAERLSTARNTVLEAYDQLIAEGLAETRGGAGTYVTSDAMPLHVATPNGVSGLVDGLSSRGAMLRGLPGAVLGARGARILAPGVPALDAFPFDVWNRCLARGQRTEAQAVVGDEDARGLRTLREAIAAHLGPARGVFCDPDDIVILTSTRQAIFLAARLCAEDGDRAWIEDPGYREARTALWLAGVHAAPVPVDADGLDVAAGRRIAPSACLAIVTASHQYPLGAVMSDDRRRALDAWAHDAKALILEDDYDGEFHHVAPPAPALAATIGRARVLYVGTFSKSIFPALRLAYLVSPPHLTDAFAAARASLDAHTGTVAQAALAEFIHSGQYARHLRTMRALYVERRAALADAIASELGDLATVLPSATGLHLTAILRADVDDERLVAALDAELYAPNPLSRTYADATHARSGLVLGYAGAAPRELRRGVAALAAAVHRVVPRS